MESAMTTSEMDLYPSCGGNCEATMVDRLLTRAELPLQHGGVQTTGHRVGRMRPHSLAVPIR